MVLLSRSDTQFFEDQHNPFFDLSEIFDSDFFFSPLRSFLLYFSAPNFLIPLYQKSSKSRPIPHFLLKNQIVVTKAQAPTFRAQPQPRGNRKIKLKINPPPKLTLYQTL